jgi:hypothetical protein
MNDLVQLSYLDETLKLIRRQRLFWALGQS